MISPSAANTSAQDAVLTAPQVPSDVASARPDDLVRDQYIVLFRDDVDAVHGLAGRLAVQVVAHRHRESGTVSEEPREIAAVGD